MKVQALIAAFLIASTSSAIPLEARDKSVSASAYTHKPNVQDVRSAQGAPAKRQTMGPPVTPKTAWIQYATQEGKSAEIIKFLQGVPDSVFDSLLTMNDPNAIEKAVGQLMSGTPNGPGAIAPVKPIIPGVTGTPNGPGAITPVKPTTPDVTGTPNAPGSIAPVNPGAVGSI
ncbi:hypothetical protein ABW20_dc0104728 [Dactylellina cionopaga]|nr:hypothetical protein ABW20_dc0104728 [Dactylellina cionopaga]